MALRLLISLVLLFNLSCLAASWIVPDERLGFWRPGATVGVLGGIPSRTNIFRTLSPLGGGLNDGTNILAAVTAAASNDVILLTAGEYRLDTSVYLDHTGGSHSYKTIRGAGTNTILRPYGNSTAFSVGRDRSWTTAELITNGYTRGSTNLTLQTTDSGWVGRLIKVTELNDSSLPVLSTRGYERQRTQITRIVAVSGYEVTVWPPIYWDMDASRVPQYSVISSSMISGVGLENMLIDATNTTSSAAMINFESSYGCWMSNVTVRMTLNRAVTITDSLMGEMRRSTIDRNQLEPASNQAGLLTTGMHGWLIEDNIINDIFPNTQINSSAGNVIAYNFSDQTYWGGALNGNHNPHSHFNLYEGNVACSFQSDGYWGSGSEDTLFRNWLHGEIPFGTPGGFTPINLNRFTRNANVVGNVLGTPRSNLTYYGMFSMGKPNMGNNTWAAGFAPPWVNAFKDSGAITYSQSGTTITASGAIFGATNATAFEEWFLLDKVDNSGHQVVSYVSPTEITVSDSATSSGHTFLMAANPSGWQERDTNVWATAITSTNYWYPYNVETPDQSYPLDPTNNTALGSSTLSNSLYRTSAPSWWGTNRWPAIDPANAQVVASIPAQDRYAGIESGGGEEGEEPSDATPTIGSGITWGSGVTLGR
jgi:hypothetical protein